MHALFSHLKGFLQETCDQNCFQQPSIKRDRGKTNVGTGRQKMKLERNEKPKGHRKQKGKKQIAPKALLAASPYVFFFNHRFFCQLRKPDPCNAWAVTPFQWSVSTSQEWSYWCTSPPCYVGFLPFPHFCFWKGCGWGHTDHLLPFRCWVRQHRCHKNAVSLPLNFLNTTCSTRIIKAILAANLKQ